MAQSLVTRLGIRAVELLDRRVGWHRLPVPLGLVSLYAIRARLREQNLHDTSGIASVPTPALTAEGERHLIARTPDGTFNDLKQPAMGAAATRFGRNIPLNRTYPEPEPAILTPNPRTVSRELLVRREFQPATTLNVLAAAWLQFMIRDWFSHGKNEKENPWVLPLGEDDPWPEHPMRILRTRRDPTRPPGSNGAAPTYVNTETHGWDASQIYGSDAGYQAKVRSGVDGKLFVGPDGLIPIDPLTPEHPADVPGFWLGLALLHTLFTREHNAICDRLKAEYPSWSDDDLFDRARLINAALLAKIHTVEWTTAILAHPTMKLAMRSNWWGLAGERLHKLAGRIGQGDLISGIPGSTTDHHTAPYALTEEFVAVYRMHPLIPDEFTFRAVADDRVLRERAFPELSGRSALEVLTETSIADILYSFGVAHPGAVTLHNYPRSLQHFVRPDGLVMDLAATDIMRSRELGVPRYNAFRQLLHRPRVESFEAMTSNPEWAEELRRVYDGDVDRVDLMVGLYAEPPPKGFGFSDTALRIFALMASRRLKSDRFFTVDYTPAVYTQAGLDWVADNDMSTVLMRHAPAIGPALRGVKNAFAPWHRPTA